MPCYRVHILDHSGKFIGVGQFDCANSEMVQARVKQLAGDLDTELWQLVSWFEPAVRTKPLSEASQAKLRIRRRLHS